MDFCMKFEKKRLSCFIPAVVYDRLNAESKNYGIPKTAIAQNALPAYYRDTDFKQRLNVENDSHTK